MKVLIVKLFVLFIRIIYFPMKWQKTQNKIVWLSRQSNEKSLDIELLEKAINEISPETIQVFRLRKLKDESALSLSYIFAVFKDMIEIASAKVVITDTYSIPVSCLTHKADLTVVQLWHALGAVKKFSLQATGKKQGRDESISKVMCMHKNYNYVIAPSQKTAEFYCEAFGCTKGNIQIATLPRVDMLLNGENLKQEFVDKNKKYDNKKIVLYLPTFRDNDLKISKELADCFENESDLELLVSPHPLSETAKSGVFIFNGCFSTQDLMKLADVIVTDYSACAFEAALLNKPLWFYVPDYDSYKAEMGLNVDLKEDYPMFTFKTAKELKDNIKNTDYDYKMLENFKNTFVENQGVDNARKLAEFVVANVK